MRVCERELANAQIFGTCKQTKQTYALRRGHEDHLVDRSVPVTGKGNGGTYRTYLLAIEESQKQNG